MPTKKNADIHDISLQTVIPIIQAIMTAFDVAVASSLQRVGPQTPAGGAKRKDLTWDRAQVAQALDVSVSHVDKLRADGQLKRINLGGPLRFKVQDVVKLIEQQPYEE